MIKCGLQTKEYTVAVKSLSLAFYHRDIKLNVKYEKPIVGHELRGKLIRYLI